METLGFILAAVVGVSLGLICSGGSILTVPILVYVKGIDPFLPTDYSWENHWAGAGDLW